MSKKVEEKKEEMSCAPDKKTAQGCTKGCSVETKKNEKRK